MSEHANDIVRTHPMVIIGGELWENPLVVPLYELLPELAAARDGVGT
jgi:hypothetical protein